MKNTVHILSAFILLIGMIAFNACTESTTQSNRFVVALHANYLHPDQTEFAFPDSKGASMQFTVQSQDTPWTIESVPEWITVSPTSGSATTNVSVTVQENPRATVRSGLFSIASASADWTFSKQLSVSQAGAKPTISIAKKAFSFDGAANSETVAATSNYEWSISNNNNWITVTHDGTQMTVSVTANDTGATRKGSVDIVFGGQVQSTVTVSQVAAKVDLKTDPLSYALSGGSYKLSIDSQAAWTVTNNTSWIEVAPASGQPGKTEVTVSVTPNPYDDARDSYVYFNFTSSGLSIAEIPIHQDGTILEVAEGADYLQHISAWGATRTWHVHSNTDWNITVPSFLTISPASGSGDAEVIVTIQENGSLDARSGWLYLKRTSTGYTQNYYVQQNALTADVSTTYLECSDLAQDLTVEVTGDADWSLKLLESASFYTASPMSARGQATIILSVQENTLDVSRTGVTEFYVNGLRDYPDGYLMHNISVVQRGWQDKYQNLKQTVEIPSKGGAMTVDVSTNDAWSAELLSAPGWITIDGSAGGKGSGSFTVNVSPNNTLDARSVKVRVTFAHLGPVEIMLTQLGRSIRINASILYFFAKGGTATVQVDADGQYSIEKASGDWFSVNPGENDTFTVTADPMSGGEERSGSIVLRLTDLESGSYSLTLQVVQMSVEGFSKGGFSEDRNLSVGTAPGFSFVVNQYTEDINWNVHYGATVGGEGYGDDENWNNQ